MGPLAFLFSVARIIAAVLLVVLSPAVDVGDVASGWVTYVILLIQGIVFALLLLVVLVKMAELLVRALGKVPFDESRSYRAGGIVGAWRRWDKGGRGNRSRRHRRSQASIAARRRSNLAASRQSQIDVDRPRSRASMGMPSPSAYSDLSAYHNRPHSPGFADYDDDGYIMSVLLWARLL